MTTQSEARVYVTSQSLLLFRAIAITEVDVVSSEQLVARSFVVTVTNDSQFFERTITIDSALAGEDGTETAHEFAIEEAQVAFEQHIIFPELERFDGKSFFAPVIFQRANSNGALAALISNESTRVNLAKLIERVHDAPLKTYLKWIESIRVTNVS